MRAVGMIVNRALRMRSPKMAFVCFGTCFETLNFRFVRLWRAVDLLKT